MLYWKSVRLRLLRIINEPSESVRMVRGMSGGACARAMAIPPSSAPRTLGSPSIVLAATINSAVVCPRMTAAAPILPSEDKLPSVAATVP